MLLTEMQGECLGLTLGRGQEPTPIRRKFLAQAEEAGECDFGFCEKLLPVIERGYKLTIDGLFEALSTITCGVAQVEHDIGDRIVIERPDSGRQLQMPRADGAGALEGEVARVVEVQLENSTVLVRGAGGDGALG